MKKVFLGLIALVLVAVVVSGCGGSETTTTTTTTTTTNTNTNTGNDNTGNTTDGNVVAEAVAPMVDVTIKVAYVGGGDEVVATYEGVEAGQEPIKLSITQFDGQEIEEVIIEMASSEATGYQWRDVNGGDVGRENSHEIYVSGNTGTYTVTGVVKGTNNGETIIGFDITIDSQ